MVLLPKSAILRIQQNSYSNTWPTFSWRRSLSYRNQSNDLICKSTDWFLFDKMFHVYHNVVFSLRTNICWELKTKTTWTTPVNVIPSASIDVLLVSLLLTLNMYLPTWYTYSAGICLFKVNNRYTRAINEICSDSTIKTLVWCRWSRYSVFTVNFGQISGCSGVSIVDFEQVNACSVHKKQAWLDARGHLEKLIFSRFGLYKMLEIVPSCNLVQYQGKLMMQLWENSKKT